MDEKPIDGSHCSSTMPGNGQHGWCKGPSTILSVPQRVLWWLTCWDGTLRAPLSEFVICILFNPLTDHMTNPMTMILTKRWVENCDSWQFRTIVMFGLFICKDVLDVVNTRVCRWEDKQSGKICVSPLLLWVPLSVGERDIARGGVTVVGGQ